MKIILIHGIGDNNPGWSAAMAADRILGVPASDIVEFSYEDLMEHNWLNRLLVWGARMAASYYAGPSAGLVANHAQDYLDDILMYFVAPGVRKAIMSRLVSVLEASPDAMIIGYSLGSVVAYETLKNYPETAKHHTLVTVGSPLGSPSLKVLLKQFLKVPDRKRPEVQGWFNLYSPMDMLSGRIDGLGCYRRDQFKVSVTHDLTAYLKHLRRLLPQQFS